MASCASDNQDRWSLCQCNPAARLQPGSGVMEFYESVQGYIATECPVCGTRLIFRPEQAGSTLKCEMCYRQIVIPQEIRVRPKPKTVQQPVEPYAVHDDE